MSPRPGLGGQGLEACRQAGKGSFWLAYQRAQVVGLRGYDKEAIRVLGEHEFRRHAADDGLMRANDRHRGRSHARMRFTCENDICGNVKNVYCSGCRWRAMYCRLATLHMHA
jgi:hypothetical protein